MSGVPVRFQTEKSNTFNLNKRPVFIHIMHTFNLSKRSVLVIHNKDENDKRQGQFRGRSAPAEG